MSARKVAGLSQEQFESLLDFLEPDREVAGRKYEQIRRRLIKIFTSRGCPNPEELVDETVDRVARKAAELAKTYQGDPAWYFLGVARHVHLEWSKIKPPSPPPPAPDSIQEYERELDCLEACMQSLLPEQSAFILDYYREEKRSRIDVRKLLAESMGIGINALRIRAHRIRAELEKCVIACLERGPQIAPAGVR